MHNATLRIRELSLFKFSQPVAGYFLRFPAKSQIALQTREHSRTRADTNGRRSQREFDLLANIVSDEKAAGCGRGNVLRLPCEQSFEGNEQRRVRCVVAPDVEARILFTE
jgi:hypothetical protein